jgi:hypothetical protein
LVDRVESTPPTKECRRGQGRRLERPKLSDRTTCTGDGEAFAASDAIDDIATVVAQVSDGDFFHRRSVSRVIQGL